MAQHRQWITAVVAAGVAGCSAPAAGQPTSPPVITVHAYNYAGVAADVLSAARNKVRAVFEKAGVDLLWSEPLSAAATVETPAACPQPFSIQLMLRPRQAEWEPGRARIMGRALAADERRAVLSVFHAAVLDVALRYRSPLDDILAVTLAHEMGHALLPPPAHATTGIMQARWEGDDIRHAVADSLSFTQAQGDAIRAKAASRCAVDLGIP